MHPSAPISAARVCRLPPVKPKSAFASGPKANWKMCIRDRYMDAIDITDEDVYCDKTRLNQVLMNLLSNAIKFTPAGGTVSLLSLIHI